MSTIKWRDSYNTGVEQFDNEHKKLVELIDLMFRAIRDNSDKAITEKICEDLISYTVYHFDNEELAMKEANYPELDEHIAIHNELKSEAVKFQKTINDNFPEGRNEFYRFLRDWLVEHIQDCDKKYAHHIQGSSET